MLTEESKQLLTLIMNNRLDIIVGDILYNLILSAPHDLAGVRTATNIKQNYKEAISYSKAALMAAVGMPKFMEEHSDKIIEMIDKHIEKSKDVK